MCMDFGATATCSHCDSCCHAQECVKQLLLTTVFLPHFCKVQLSGRDSSCGPVSSSSFKGSAQVHSQGEGGHCVPVYITSPVGGPCLFPATLAFKVVKINRAGKRLAWGNLLSCSSLSSHFTIPQGPAPVT